MPTPESAYCSSTSSRTTARGPPATRPYKPSGPCHSPHLLLGHHVPHSRPRRAPRIHPSPLLPQSRTRPTLFRLNFEGPGHCPSLGHPIPSSLSWFSPARPSDRTQRFHPGRWPHLDGQYCALERAMDGRVCLFVTFSGTGSRPLLRLEHWMTSLEIVLLQPRALKCKERSDNGGRRGG